jgi:repressor LexA
MAAVPPITPKQFDVLVQLGKLEARSCCSATIAELANALGISRPTVYEHLVALREKKLVHHTPGKARSLRLTEAAKRLLSTAPPPESETLGFASSSLPLAGMVCAGYGIDTFENTEPFRLDDLFGNSGDLFVLQVKGRSMIGAGIEDGDYVICRRASVAENGQLVIAILEDGAAMLKRFYREPDCVCLMPANDAFEPVYSRQCRIQAVVTGLIRRLKN